MRIKVWVETGYAGADHEDFEELPDGWEDMDEKEREAYLNEIATNYRDNVISCGARVVE